MTNERNSLGQPIGAALPGRQPPPVPPREPMEGRDRRIEPLDAARHAADLHAANALDRRRPQLDLPQHRALRRPRLRTASGWKRRRQRSDPLFHAIVDPSTRKAVGVASYMRIDSAHGAVEVGHLNYSPLLQRKPAATEAMYLMMKRAFDLGYRRYEWKCDALECAVARRGAAPGLFLRGRFPAGHEYTKGAAATRRGFR